MNLHAIAAAAIQVVNPSIPATIRRSTGYITEADGRRVPTYDTIADVTAQFQALLYQDLQMLDGLQIQGERRKVYLFGHYKSLDRDGQTGGDLLEFPDGTVWPYGTTWYVALVTETWPDWCCAYVTQQLSSTA